jgi:hypothetical protein
MSTLITNRQRRRLVSMLLLLLTFGAYIPVGFMPAAGTPFLLEICPDAGLTPASMLTSMSGMPAEMPMDMPMDMSMAVHHGGTHTHFEHCPFGSAPGAGPLSQGIVFLAPAPVSSDLFCVLDAAHPGSRPQRAHQPRGPPSPV